MSLLRSIETRIATLVEGAFGKVFRSGVQPVELARRLTGEMDDHQRATMHQVFVPNVYEIYLSSDDHAKYRDVAAALGTELGEYLAEHARRRGYALATRPRVTLHRDTDLDLGSFGILAKSETPDSAEPVAASSGPAAAVVHPPVEEPSAVEATFVAPAPDPDPIELTVEGKRIRIDAAQTKLTLGRGKANDVVLQDSSVSRAHAEVVRKGSGFVVRDLGSTNGVLVNGDKVTERPIQAGDEILLGSAPIQVSSAPPSNPGAEG